MIRRLSLLLHICISLCYIFLKKILDNLMGGVTIFRENEYPYERLIHQMLNVSFSQTIPGKFFTTTSTLNPTKPFEV